MVNKTPPDKSLKPEDSGLGNETAELNISREMLSPPDEKRDEKFARRRETVGNLADRYNLRAEEVEKAASRWSNTSFDALEAGNKVDDSSMSEPSSIDTIDLIDVIRDIDSPAVTSEEISSYFDVPNSDVEKILSAASSAGFLSCRRSGVVTLWWVNKDVPLELLDSSTLDLIEEKLDDDETVVEYLRRNRGTPDIEILRNMMDDITIDGEELKEKLNERRKKDNDRKDKLMNYFS